MVWHILASPGYTGVTSRWGWGVVGYITYVWAPSWHTYASLLRNCMTAATCSLAISPSTSARKEYSRWNCSRGTRAAPPSGSGVSTSQRVCRASGRVCIVGRRVKWKEVWCVDERRWKKREGKQGGKERGGGRGRFLAYEKSEANSRCLFQSLLRRSSINLQLSSDINYQRLKQLSGWGVCIFLFLLLHPSGVSAHLLQCCAGQCEQFLPLNLLSRKVSNTGKSGQTKDLADHNVLGLKSICCVCH